jgi:hypothetical protein
MRSACWQSCLTFQCAASWRTASCVPDASLTGCMRTRKWFVADITHDHTQKHVTRGQPVGTVMIRVASPSRSHRLG